MASNDLNEAIHSVQQELRALSDHARFSQADEFSQGLWSAVSDLANVVEALMREVDHPVQDGQSLKPQGGTWV